MTTNEIVTIFLQYGIDVRDYWQFIQLVRKQSKPYGEFARRLLYDPQYRKCLSYLLMLQPTAR